MRPPARQLLVALDAMEWRLVERWSSAGKLPTFRRLIDQGSRGVLASTAEQLPDTIWSCLYTGVNPGGLEKYFYVQYDARTQGLRHVMDDAITRPAFWDYLSEAGVAVGVVDAPKVKLSRTIGRGGGFQLANWGAHATKTARASHPAALLDEVSAQVGPHAVGDCDAVDPTPRALVRLRDNILAGVRQRGRLFRHLMRGHAWQVFLAGFSEPHCVGHHFWQGVDGSHPQHQAAVDAGIDGAVEDVYRAIDAELGAMIEAAGPDVRVMVFAAHGMGPSCQASWHLPEMLEVLGYGASPVRAARAGRARAARVNPWRWLKQTVPAAWQYRIKAMLPQPLQDQLLFAWYAGGRRWRGARAFAVPNNDTVGAIRLAVKGRDRYGVIEPGDEYRRVCDDIADALYALTDPVSGRRVITRVTRVHDECHGRFADQLPDLTALWDSSFPWTSLHSPRLGTLHLRGQDARTGGHSPRGFVLASGAGRVPRLELAGHSILDIAPTILRAAGVRAPDTLEGRALPLGEEAP